MSEARNIIIVQTAFLGDVILTLPLAQVLKRKFPSSRISFVVVPAAAELLGNHPAIDDPVVYDKRGRDRGLSGLFRLGGELRKRRFDTALVPHRSLRSAALVRIAGIGTRIGFDASAGRFLFNRVIPYERTHHEVRRNLSLLAALGIETGEMEFPALYPARADEAAAAQFLTEKGIAGHERLIGFAPGTVWNTKRWPLERFAETARTLASSGHPVVLIGGRDDAPLADAIIREAAPGGGVVSAAGRLSLLASAALIRRCAVLLSNDSAPVHLALAVRTPVIVIYGATIPGFGFAPYGERDRVVETHALVCRPCSIHGGEACPVKTFECMMNISAAHIVEEIKAVLT